MKPELALVFWPAATVLAYAAARVAYRRRKAWWSSALVLTPALLLGLGLLMHADYREYMLGSHWLLAMTGPVIVAFALPLYEQRALIRRYWPVLLVGVAVGSVIAGGTGWLLGRLLNLPEDLSMSLVARSVATPFAMSVSRDVGGMPDVTAVFVIVTGVLGTMVGQWLRACLPLRSSLARGALFGMGAHGAGTAKAREYAAEEGAVAGLVMVLAGLANVLVTPVAVYWLMR